MNKKTVIILSIITTGILIFGGWKYMTYKEYCKVYYPQNTIINEVDCSGMTMANAKEALTKKWNQQEFTISSDGETIAVLKDMSFTYAIDDDLLEILDKGHSRPIITALFKQNQDLTIEMTPAAWTKNFNRQIENLPIYDNDNPVATENAYVSMETNEFKIIAEIYGNDIDTSVLKNTVTALIADDTWELEYNEENFYVQPTLKKDSEEILKRQEYCKTYLSHVITYTFGSKTQVISPTQMNEMLSADSNGKITIDEDAVSSFVKALADTHNTVGTVRAFPSTLRGTVYIGGGTYGYTINESAEIEQLTSDLKGLKDVTREPVYAKKGLSWENGDIGNTYVEVDLANQQLWYYLNGECIVSCPIVSGCVETKHQTVRGIFPLAYKTRDVTLKGGNEEDDTDYESDVRYWMPFYGDYGLHDADWRTTFGGEIYKTAGSHGCINMPIPSAETLYNNISPGCPVIVYA